MNKIQQNVQFLVQRLDFRQIFKTSYHYGLSKVYYSPWCYLLFIRFNQINIMHMHVVAAFSHGIEVRIYIIQA